MCFNIRTGWYLRDQSSPKLASYRSKSNKQYVEKIANRIFKKI